MKPSVLRSIFAFRRDRRPSARLGSVSLLLAILALPGCQHSKVEAGAMPVTDLRTTDGRVAMANLQAQIDGLSRRKRSDAASANAIAGLIAMRGRYTGNIADYERVTAMAATTVAAFPSDPNSHLLQAQAQALFHRFDAALAELDAAEELKAKRRDLDVARAGIYQAKGRYEDALAIREQLAAGHADMEALGALAALEGERGNWENAEHLYDAAWKQYRDVSPFPVAWLLFEQGNMWMRAGSLARARTAFQAAWERLPDYAPAQGHLAEVELALGNVDRAVELMRPLASGSDPDYAAQLARALDAAGQTEEADKWRHAAAKGFDALSERHPEAFADHAAEFWLQAGHDPRRALQLAQLNLAVRQTPRAYELVLQAALAAGDTGAACSAAGIAQGWIAASPALAELIALSRTTCGNTHGSDTTSTDSNA